MHTAFSYAHMNRLTEERRENDGDRYDYYPAENGTRKQHYHYGQATEKNPGMQFQTGTIGNNTSVCGCDITEREENYCYNGENQLTERKNPSGITEYVYDGNGSLISEKEGGKTTSYQYDLLNRQEKIWTSDGREQENLYDGEGLRAGLREKGKESAFLFYNGEILAECDGDGMPVRRHLQGMGLSYVQTLDDGMYHACHQDEQGSTAFITGDGGEVENSYVYDAFGNVLERKEGIRNDILYRGQKYDQEAGQYYLRARYYNPVIGRFIQEDTYRGDGLNLYAYCGNNPVMYYDPSGHTKVTPPTTEPEVPRTAGNGNLISNSDVKPDGVTYEGPLYRNVGTMPDGTPVNPLETSDFTKNQNYRYTQNGQNGLYFASNQHVMEGEMGAYGSNPYADNRTTYRYDNVTLNNMLDLTNPNTRDELGIDLSDLISSDYKNYNTATKSPAVTHAMGNFAAQNGYTGLIVPSARADGGVNIVIFDSNGIDFGTYTTIHDKY